MSTEKHTRIMFDSYEAASFKTDIEGWVSRDGLFYGKDERGARWSGCTHQACEQCGEEREKSSYCRPCRNKKMSEKFASYPVEKWDGVTPLCVFDSETYFFDEDSLLDYLSDLKEGEEPCICKCEPGYLSLISDDNWCDDLPEDGELPDAVSDALEALNKAIRDAAPVCWYEDKVAIDVSYYMRTAKAQRKG